MGQMISALSRFAIVLAGVLCLGCGGSESVELGNAASTDEIAAFIEANPQFADSSQLDGSGAEPAGTDTAASSGQDSPEALGIGN